uniref:Plasma membrane ATPase 4-like n=1 Tax=Tanacetum cinerariifolium TaxID=118510 RepID=A0A6L2L3G7_TANCI|nr:plasma membrane ATPase 4-like [Tanacetum cinerariifolium]
MLNKLAWTGANMALHRITRHGIRPLIIRFTRREKDCFMSKGIKQSPWEKEFNFEGDNIPIVIQPPCDSASKLRESLELPLVPRFGNEKVADNVVIWTGSRLWSGGCNVVHTTILMGAMDSRVENQNAIDACIAVSLPDLIEARARINKLKFLPYIHVDKRTTLTYLDQIESWHRVSKNAPDKFLAVGSQSFNGKQNWSAIKAPDVIPNCRRYYTKRIDCDHQTKTGLPLGISLESPNVDAIFKGRKQFWRGNKAIELRRTLELRYAEVGRKKRLIDRVEKLFAELKSEGLEPDMRVYIEVIRPSLKVEMIDKAIETYELMKALGKLMTQDRLKEWNPGVDFTCFLCSACEDSHNHLFFQCTFSSKIWKSMKDRAKMKTQNSGSLQNVVEWIAVKPFKNNIWRILQRKYKEHAINLNSQEVLCCAMCCQNMRAAVSVWKYILEFLWYDQMSYYWVNWSGSVQHEGWNRELRKMKLLGPSYALLKETEECSIVLSEDGTYVLREWRERFLGNSPTANIKGKGDVIHILKRVKLTNALYVPEIRRNLVIRNKFIALDTPTRELLKEKNRALEDMVNAMFLSPGLSHVMWGEKIEKSSRMDDEVVQDQRKRDDNDLQDERQYQPKEEDLNLEEAKGQE